jgi:hypothetical protein
MIRVGIKIYWSINEHVYMDYEVTVELYVRGVGKLSRMGWGIHSRVEIYIFNKYFFLEK